MNSTMIALLVGGFFYLLSQKKTAVVTPSSVAGLTPTQQAQQAQAQKAQQAQAAAQQAAAAKAAQSGSKSSGAGGGSGGGSLGSLLNSLGGGDAAAAYLKNYVANVGTGSESVAYAPEADTSSFQLEPISTDYGTVYASNIDAQIQAQSDSQAQQSEAAYEDPGAYGQPSDSGSYDYNSSAAGDFGSSDGGLGG